MRPCFPAIAFLLALTCLSSCAHVKVINPNTNLELTPAPYFDNATGIYFPGALGPLFRKPVVKLEEHSPGLGFAISYRNPEARIDVFVFDLQASIIPIGTNSDVIEMSFRDAIADLELANSKKIYSHLDLGESQQTGITQTAFLHAKFSYTEGLIPKEGQLFVAGVNSKILKIRTAKRLGSQIDMDLLLSYIGRTIEESHRNGYGGISNLDYQNMSEQLAHIDLADGLSESEAISIAQIELVQNKLHNRYDAVSATPATSHLPQAATTIEFSQYPTDPPRLNPIPIRITVSETGLAEIDRDQP